MKELADPPFGLNAAGSTPERAEAVRAYGPFALSSLPPIIRAMRPLQWTKDGLVLAPLLFTHMFFDLEPVVRSIVAAVIFCAVSSAIYLVNDVRDVEQDLTSIRENDSAKSQPGELEVSTALITAAALVAVGLSAAFVPRPAFGALIIGYIALMVAYAYGL